MPTFVCLLRGVNVGKGQRVPMAELRRLLQALGHGGVQTLLNSGNAVFTSPQRSADRHAQAVHAALQSGLGLDVPVIVKTAADFLAALQQQPFSEAHTRPSQTLIAWASSPATLAGLAGLGEAVHPPDRFVLGRHAAYLYCPAGILASTAAKALLGRRGAGFTTRNLATATKLAALLAPNPDQPQEPPE